MQSEIPNFPLVAKALGYGGVIPFVALSFCIIAGVDLGSLGVTDAADKLLGYGAVIVSFIGAVHWGIALQSLHSKSQNRLFLYSVVPALLAWVWLFFSVKAALAGMGLTVLLMFFIDRWSLAGLVSPAYLKMRLHLSVVVASCLLLAALRA